MKETTLFILLAFFLFSCGNDAPVKETNTEMPSSEQKTEAVINTPPREVVNQTAVVDQTKKAQATLQKKNDKNYIVGIFKYMADAAIFTDCSTQKKMPVAMKYGYIDLERAYLKAVEGGTPVLITVEGSIEQEKNKDFLIIKRFVSLEKDKICGK